MKRGQFFAFSLATLMSIFFVSSSWAQTGSYSCNIIYGDDINHPLAGVQVDLYNSTNDFIATTTTGNDGFYTFDNLIIGESYTAKFTYDAEVDFVDLEDAFSLLEYLNGFEEFSDQDLLVADVDANNVIDSDDFWYILYYYFINDISFPAGDWIIPNWEFVMADGKLVGGPGSGKAVGDFTTENSGKSTQNISIDYNDLIVLDYYNNDVVIPMYFGEDISTNGIGLVLEYNNDLIDVTKIESPIEGLNYSINNGVIKIGWVDYKKSYNFSTDQPLINIHIKENKDLANGQVEQFKLLKGTHILDIFGNKYPYINFVSSEFKLSNAPIKSSTLGKAYPNPCINSFTINIGDQDNKQADVQIFNSLGQLIKSETYNSLNGNITINTNKLNTGVYIYYINNHSSLIRGTVSIQK